MNYNDLQRLLNMEKTYYTVQDAANKLNVHWQTILNCIKRGELEAIRIGRGYRISPEALEAFIKQRTTKKKPQ